MTLQEQVNEALRENIALSNAEAKAKYEEADKITRAHGVRGKSSKDERKRLRRMTMNYYGTMLNVVCSLLSSVDYLTKMSQEQSVMLAGIYQKLEDDKRVIGAEEGTNERNE